METYNFPYYNVALIGFVNQGIKLPRAKYSIMDDGVEGWEGLRRVGAEGAQVQVYSTIKEIRVKDLQKYKEISH